TIDIKKKIDISKYDEVEEAHSYSESGVPNEIDILGEEATHVIKGKVTEVNYVFLAGDARTAYNVLVEESYKGDLQKNDLITVYKDGGYIPLRTMIELNGDAFRYEGVSQEAIDSTIVHEVVDGEEEPYIGEEGVFYLLHNYSSFLPEGAFERVNGIGSQLEAESKNIFIQTDEEREEKEVTLKEIKESVE
ncbi:MAG: hypothetical protein K6G65_00370, partial [Lachnospiraceae bacterium]|nr:hypothetical protein [Lachnospiraceae bacterium]